MPSTVRVKKGALPNLPSRIEMRVGILEPGGAHPGGPTVGEIGAKHEFGLGVPERSFIRAWFDEQQNAVRAVAVDQMVKGYLSGSILRGAQLTAVKAAALVQNRIAAGIEPALAPATEAARMRKGQSPPFTPLIETGVLKSSIVGEATAQ